MKSIKYYQNFLLEKNSEIAKQIASLAEDDSYAQNLISEYLKDFDTSIDLVSSLSLLDEKTQLKILNLIKKYKVNKEVEEPVIMTNTDLNLLESNQILAGTNLFNCYLKVLTALGSKNIQPNWESTPKDFLIYYITPELEYLDIRMVTSRFKYLDKMFEDLKTSSQKAQLYFGIRNDMMIEYGVLFQESIHKIGEFKFSKTFYNSVINSTYLALINLKSFFNNFGYEKVKLLCRIKREMNNFKPGYFEDKSKPFITDNIFTFGYFGIGRWDNGIMDEYEVESVKNNLKHFLIQFAWSQDVKISVVAKDLWVYLNIKLK